MTLAAIPIAASSHQCPLRPLLGTPRICPRSRIAAECPQALNIRKNRHQAISGFACATSPDISMRVVPPSARLRHHAASGQRRSCPGSLRNKSRGRPAPSACPRKCVAVARPIKIKPTLLIELYASNRLILSLPDSSECANHDTRRAPRRSRSAAKRTPVLQMLRSATRKVRAIAATFGAVAKKVVTGVGAPSYTSGRPHVERHRAEILNANPARTKISPNNAPVDKSSKQQPGSINSEIASLPVKP